MILSLPVLPGCGPRGQEPSGSSQAPQITPEDENQEYPVTAFQVTVEAYPERVVSLSPAVTSMLLDLGYGSRLTGVSDYCEGLSGDLPMPVGSALLPDWDAIQDADPELILTSAPLTELDLSRLETMGIPVIQINSPVTLEAWLDTCQGLCILLDGNVAGAELGNAFQEDTANQLEKIQEGISTYLADAEEDRLKAIYLQDLPFSVSTGDTIENSILEAAGLENLADGYRNWAFPPEALENAQPDLVLVNKGGDITAEASIAEAPVLQSLTAAEQGDILEIDGRLLELPSLQWIDLVREIAAFAYPDADI